MYNLRYASNLSCPLTHYNMSTDMSKVIVEKMVLTLSSLVKRIQSHNLNQVQ